MRDTFLEFAPPCLGEEEIAEVVETLRSGWITTGPQGSAIRGGVGDSCWCGGCAGDVLGDRCHAGRAGRLGSRGGDEVITTPMTFSSTVHVIEHVGATPVLVDVEPDTLCIDPEKIAAAIGPRTKAILPVHLYGHPCEMREDSRAGRSDGFWFSRMRPTPCPPASRQIASDRSAT